MSVRLVAILAFVLVFFGMFPAFRGWTAAGPTGR